MKRVGASKLTGTKVTFLPDKEIFATMEYSEKKVLDHLRQQAYLTKGVRLNILDKRSVPHNGYGFYFEGGLKSFVKYLARDEKQLQEEIFYVHKEQSATAEPEQVGGAAPAAATKEKRKSVSMDVEIAFTYVEDIETRELSFANNIYTPDGGMHLTGFRSALTRTLNAYARGEKYLKEKDENLTSDDTREGLVAVVSVKLR